MLDKQISRRMMIGGAIAGMAATLSACDTSANYRTTVSVDIDGKTYSGSGVQKFTCHLSANGMDTYRYMVKGEAIVVDLKERGYLFLIFSGKHGDESSMVVSILGARGQKPFEPATSNLPSKWELQPEDMPMMVTFADVNDPKSVKEVDRTDLSKTFGPGASLKSVTIEASYDSVSRGRVSHVLPWINRIGLLTLDGKRLIDSNDLANRLDRSYFIRDGLF